MSRIGKLARGLGGLAWPGHRSYSQFGEDRFVAGFFADQPVGTWLDIGAFHPRVASNTLALRRRGWRGVNVDADPDKVRLLELVRRRDVNIVAAVGGPSSGRAVLEHHGSGSYGSMDRLRLGAGLDEGVPTRTIEAVLAEADVRAVDFVSIDVEGLELEILSGFPFEQARVKLFCIEVLDWSLEGVLGSGVTSLLEQHGYQVVGWTPPSVFYAWEPRPS